MAAGRNAFLPQPQALSEPQAPPEPQEPPKLPNPAGWPEHLRNPWGDPWEAAKHRLPTRCLLRQSLGAKALSLAHGCRDRISLNPKSIISLRAYMVSLLTLDASTTQVGKLSRRKAS